MTDWLDRYDRLKELAQLDEIYLFWCKMYENYTTAFREYANAQPQELRDLLVEYAESGRLIYQRLANLACMHMDFLNVWNKDGMTPERRLLLVKAAAIQERSAFEPVRRVYCAAEDRVKEIEPFLPEGYAEAIWELVKAREKFDEYFLLTACSKMIYPEEEK